MSAIRNALNGFPNLADRRSDNLFLMRSPWPTIIITYFYVKWSMNWGPKWMKSKQSFQIDRIIQIYDFFQVLFNVYMVYEVVKWVHLYYLIKIVDLLDTVFFVLRKKQNQVTGLHVYHHSSMLVHVWAGVRFAPGGHYTFTVLANSFIHAVMYGHYLIMSLKIWQPWWKRHLTEMQILQFVIVLVHMSQVWWVKDCKFPKWLSFIIIPQDLMMIWMFSNFYYRSYVRKPVKESGNIKNAAKTENQKRKKYLTN